MHAHGALGVSCTLWSMHVVAHCIAHCITHCITLCRTICSAVSLTIRSTNSGAIGYSDHHPYGVSHGFPYWSAYICTHGNTDWTTNCSTHIDAHCSPIGRSIGNTIS